MQVTIRTLDNSVVDHAVYWTDANGCKFCMFGNHKASNKLFKTLLRLQELKSKRVSGVGCTLLTDSRENWLRANDYC